VKEVEGYERQLNSHSKEIALHKDNLEVIRMESSVALEEQKDASSKNKQSQQTSMKSFYEETLNSKNRDIEDLKHKLTEKDSDLRDLIVKYNALEKKLAALLETQEKLRDFETKVVSLGQDTNILKNMAEMIKSRGK
jgi:chromosome segregation ATPase